MDSLFTRQAFQDAFRLPDSDKLVIKIPSEFEKSTQIWTCNFCGCDNLPESKLCVACGLDWTGNMRPGADQWACPSCTFWNKNTDFYCDQCDKARPEYASMRL